jgi:hypothetical protein
MFLVSCSAATSPSIQINGLCNLTDKLDTQTFTWISHTVNASMAQWLYNLNFTDVAVRYVTQDEYQQSQANLAPYNITPWYVVEPNYFWNCTTQQDFASALHNLTLEYSRFIVDDADFIFALTPFNTWTYTQSQRLELLQALKNCSGNVILLFYEPFSHAIFSQYSFADVNVDFFFNPPDLNVTFLESVKTQVKSLGIYLWVWDGFSYNWTDLQPSDVMRLFIFAHGCQRFTAWMGDETAIYERDMPMSSLYNYPSWWNVISSMNDQLRN